MRGNRDDRLVTRRRQQVDARNLIGGEWVDTAAREDVKNPAQWDQVVGTIPQSDANDVERAVQAADAARRAWKAMGAVARGNLLFQAANLLEAHLEELGTLAAQEMGKPIGEARGEAARAVAILRYYGGEGLRSVGEVIPAANPTTLQYTTREPLGVVGLITPWNFPLAIPMWKAAPALVYGNTLVMKPAELASLTAYRMWQLIAPLFPAGVINLVLGRGTVAGEALIQHPMVEGISFTGSTGVGQHIAQVAVSRGVKYQLEMGGKNPVIVADDADLDLAVELTVSGAMRSAGQKCTATSRVIVMEGIRQEFTERLVQRVGTLSQGDPRRPDTYLGPVVSEAQYQKVLSLIEKGRAEGGRLLAGGNPLGGQWARGYFVPPTVFDEVSPTATIAQEEIFGPVVAVIPVKTVQEAIDVANGVRYGLSASVFTKNLKTAMAFVEGIEAGLVRVNEETAGVELQAPFGGVKASSSHSREQGRAAMDFYTHTKTVAIRPV